MLVGIAIYMIAFGLLIRYRGASVGDHAGMIGGQGEFKTRSISIELASRTELTRSLFFLSRSRSRGRNVPVPSSGSHTVYYEASE